VTAETATIRVTRATRDLLAKQAQARGTSLAALLADVAREREAQSIWSSEREASRVDAENLDVAAEDRVWEATLVDGLD
jgi:antitoxin MazE7